jgi:hypothetical protein
MQGPHPGRRMGRASLVKDHGSTRAGVRKDPPSTKARTPPTAHNTALSNHRTALSRARTPLSPVRSRSLHPYVAHTAVLRDESSQVWPEV